MTNIIKKRRSAIFETGAEVDEYFASPVGQKELEESAKGPFYSIAEGFAPLYKKIEQRKKEKLVTAGFTTKQISLVQSIYVHPATYQTV